MNPYFWAFFFAVPFIVTFGTPRVPLKTSPTQEQHVHVPR